MKCLSVFAVVLNSIFLLLSGSLQISAQVCQDDQAMVADSYKAMTDLVEVVKKESLAQFQGDFHKKIATSKLTMYATFVDGLISCLQENASDPATLKADADASKAKIDTYNKLKDTIKHDRDALKAARSDKDAKALIEKFAFTN